MDFGELSLPDLVAGVLLAASFWVGYGFGFIRILLWMGKWCGSIAASFFLCPCVGEWLEQAFPLETGWGAAIAWAALFVLFTQLFQWAERMIDRRTKSPRVVTLPMRLSGAALGLLTGFGLTGLLALAGRESNDTQLRSEIRAGWLSDRLAEIPAGFARAAGLPLSDDSPFGYVSEDLLLQLSSDAALATAMTDSINGLRKQQKLPPLQPNKVLELAALQHARDMLTRDYFSHRSPEGFSPFDRLNRLGIPYRQAGENLALAANVEEAHRALVKSPGHRENLERKAFRKVGIVAIRLNRQKILFVQEFSN